MVLKRVGFLPQAVPRGWSFEGRVLVVGGISVKLSGATARQSKRSFQQCSEYFQVGGMEGNPATVNIPEPYMWYQNVSRQVEEAS